MARQASEEGGLTPEDVARTMFNAFRLLQSAHGVETEEWEFLEPAVQGAFVVAFEALQVRVEEAADASIPALADFARRQFLFTAGADPLPFDEIAPADRLVWVGLVRHMANVLQYDDEDGDLADFESGIVAWFHAAVKETEGVSP